MRLAEPVEHLDDDQANLPLILGPGSLGPELDLDGIPVHTAEVWIKVLIPDDLPHSVEIGERLLAGDRLRSRSGQSLIGQAAGAGTGTECGEDSEGKESHG